MKKMQKSKLTRVWILALSLALFASSAFAAGENRVFTARIDPEESVEVYITIKDCAVYIEPTDEKMIDLKYDTGALRLEQSIAQGTQKITISSISGKRVGYEAAATLYLPQNSGFSYVFVDVQNGETMLMKGIGASFDISGNGADISIQYTPDAAHPYNMRLAQSRCTFAIDENATDYKITAQVNGGNITVPMDGMPAYKATSGKVGEYNFSKGTGAASITADVGDASVLSFAFVRRGN